MQKNHFPPLDGLRGIAILLVILTHCFHYRGAAAVGKGLDTVARAGWVGVTLFFVLSGFLITGILLDTRGRAHYFRDFFARRSLRIFPLYFGFLAVYFFVVPHVRPAAEHLPQPPPEMRVYYWTYTTNVRETLGGSGESVPPLDPLWSLAVEEQVYLVWPFLVLAVPPRRLASVLAALALGSFAWRFLARLATDSMELSYTCAPANLDSFAVGALVALYYREHPALLRAWAPVVCAASGFFVLGLRAGQGHFNIWQGPDRMLTVGSTAAVVFFGSVIACSVTAGEHTALNRLLSASWLRAFGKYSYAIYLFHSSAVELLRPTVFSRRPDLAPEHDLPGNVILTLAVAGVSFVAAVVSWHVWENRFLRLKKYFPLSARPLRPVPEPDREPQPTDNAGSGSGL